jgi:CubicO group peptidase (beta-lactamase class C family)
MLHRLAVLLLSFVVLVVFSVSASKAQDETEQRAAKLIAGWEQWAKKHDVKQTAIAIAFDCKIVAEGGIGRTSTNPAPVASLSKSVTGICIAKLVENGELSFGEPLSRIIPEMVTDATIASLLTHTSGYTHDITQKPAKYKGVDREYLEWVSEKEIAKGRDKAQIGKFHYNNANYAMLGAAIRKVTGKTYEEACKELVFEPLGISNVSLNPDWRIMSSWGGWKLSAFDNLKFVNAYFDRRKVIGKFATSFPNVKFDNGLAYGMGYNFRTGRKGGTNFWHSGRWHSDRDGKKYRFGAYFVSFDNGWSVTANYSISAINNEDGELDRIIGEATHLPM